MWGFFFPICWKIVQVQCVYPDQAECQFAIAVLPPAGNCEGPVIRLMFILMHGIVLVDQKHWEVNEL